MPRAARESIGWPGWHAEGGVGGGRLTELAYQPALGIRSAPRVACQPGLGVRSASWAGLPTGGLQAIMDEPWPASRRVRASRDGNMVAQPAEPTDFCAT